MKLYLNRGIIIEQAVADAIKAYFSALRLDAVYQNFSVAVTCDHPFARLIADAHSRSVDYFPCVVVATVDESKTGDLQSLNPHCQEVEVDAEALASIIDGAGSAGVCTVCDTRTKDALQSLIDERGAVDATVITTRRSETISVEIWAENVQLKNELYEQVRLFVLGDLRFVLSDAYPFFDIAIVDGSVRGNRSNNFNADFDVVLAGAQITFTVNYQVQQIVFEQEATAIQAIEAKGENYVKE